MSEARAAKKLHISIATDDLAASVADYTQRLGSEPALVVGEIYALWRTETLNFSVKNDGISRPGELRHLGWEDPEAEGFVEEPDVNGMVWEYFNATEQAEKILAVWPDCGYPIPPRS